MNRLFTFGCSFTGYGWPTWADICGKKFDSYINYGKSGAGNHFITSSLIECDRIYNLTENDTVLVMYTGYTRFDTLVNGQWASRGNIFNTGNFFDEKFLSEYWSVDYGMQTTWLHINHAKIFLTNKNIKHKIMSAFDLYPGGCSEYNEIFNTTSEKFSKEYVKDLDKIIDIKISMYDWLKKKYGDNLYQKFYKFKRNQNMFWVKEGVKEWTDGHPTIEMHYEWVKEFLPEFLPENYDIDKETLIHYDYDNYVPNHRSGKCICCRGNRGYPSHENMLWH